MKLTVKAIRVADACRYAEMAAFMQRQADAIKRHAVLVASTGSVLGNTHNNEKHGNYELEQVRKKLNAYYCEVLVAMGSCILQAESYALDAKPRKSATKKATRT